MARPLRRSASSVYCGLSKCWPQLIAENERKQSVRRAYHHLLASKHIYTIILGILLLGSCASSITIGPQGVTIINSSLSAELRPTFGSSEVTSESPPLIARIIAGGIIDARRVVSQECSGHIAREPDYTISLLEDVGEITFTARAFAGLSLIISDLDGTLTCTTNLGRADARWSISDPTPGRYAIWLAVDPRGNTVDAGLRVEVNQAT